ncbi:MAG: hypothetical protein IT280_05790 [Ignavibacteria bacterium]|nr:hypothetical protein [Ignavibacteria bacterium]
MKSESWKAIFDLYKISSYDFTKSPFIITAEQIKNATSHFKKTTEKEVRILCKQDSREKRPQVFIENELFLLPIKNGTFAIVKGEGYIDIPDITTIQEIYSSKLEFELVSSKVGDSEMQHLDFAYAVSLIRTFIGDQSLVLTIRGRKYTPEFSFNVGKQKINVSGVQTEVDAGYEGRDKIVLIEAKNRLTKNTIIRQLYYPLRLWTERTNKKVITLFFEKRNNEYLFWKFDFADINDYNSIILSDSKKYIIK